MYMCSSMTFINVSQTVLTLCNRTCCPNAIGKTEDPDPSKRRRPRVFGRSLEAQTVHSMSKVWVCNESRLLSPALISDRVGDFGLVSLRQLDQLVSVKDARGIHVECFEM